MRIATCTLGLALLLLALAAPAQSISDVLLRSQQMRLAKFDAADPQRDEAQRIRATLARLNTAAAAQGLPPVELLLVDGGLFAEAQFGRPAIAVSLGVGELPEGERTMMLAHELGHVHLNHWQALRELYTHYIPGEVRPETTDQVSGELGRAAHLQSHEHELAADAFGLRMLLSLGFDVNDACSLLTRNGMQFDTATHPATRKRLAQLRLLDEQLHSPVTAMVTR
jgi:Zn-dependent protease with chaperone function